jgi:hypothetical protein
MTMYLKPGVKLTALQPQMVLAAAIVHSIYQRNNVLCTITSANDSTHMVGSLHYSGCALDFRTKNYASSKALLVEQIKTALGDDFDVVFEGQDTDNEHLHVEYQPK